MGSYPYTSRRFDRFEVYTETAIGYLSDHGHEMEMYDKWMAVAGKYLERFGPLAKQIMDDPGLRIKLVMLTDELPSFDERDGRAGWDRFPCSYRMVMRGVCGGYMEIDRVDVIMAVAEMPRKEDVEALKGRLLEAARKACPKRTGLFV